MNIELLSQILLAMTVGLFLLGSVTFITGIIILTTRSFGKDIRTITKQTVQLAQKGMANDISGLVGNASALLNATGSLIKTAAGIGVFLTLLGLVMISASFALAFYTIKG